MKLTGRLGAYLAVVALVLMLVLSRAPFMSNTLVGEEGTVAYFVLAPQPTADLSKTGLPELYVGEIHDEPILGFTGRTIMPYYIVEDFGRLLVPRIDLARTPDFWISVAARWPFVVFYIVGVIGLGALIVHLKNSPGRYVPIAAIALYATTAPLAVGGSIQPQLDGSVGVMLLGSAAAILVFLRGGLWRTVGFSAAAGLLCGLGKHEWALAVVGGCVLTASMLGAVFVLARSVELRSEVIRAVPVPAGIVVGVGLGVALSYVASPANYIGGLDLTDRILGATSDKWINSVRMLNVGYPVLIACAIGSLLFILEPKRALLRAPGAVVMLAAGGAIAAAFLSSGWTADGFPRYLAPSLVMAAYAASAFLAAAEKERRAVQIGLVTLALVGTAVNARDLWSQNAKRISITSLYGISLVDVERQYQRAIEVSSKGFVPVTGTPVGIYEPSANFVSVDLGIEGAKATVAEVAPELADKVVMP